MYKSLMLLLFSTIIVMTGCNQEPEMMETNEVNYDPVSYGPENQGVTQPTEPNGSNVTVRQERFVIPITPNQQQAVPGRGMYQNDRMTDFNVNINREERNMNRNNEADNQARQNNVAQNDQNQNHVAQPDATEKKTEENKVAQPDTAKEEATEENQQADSFTEEVIRLTNQEREKNGLPALKSFAELSNVAKVKSEDMAENDYFSHTSPTYGSPFDMLKQFGIQYTTAAENIAAGQKSPEAVVNSWMNSAGHRQNILNKDVTHIGVGHANDEQKGIYWTQMFIKK